MGKQAAGPGLAGGSLALAAAILSSSFLLTQAQEIHIRMEPSQPSEGANVTLTPGGVPDFVVCSWYRGMGADMNRIVTYIPSSRELLKGPKFAGRETSGPRCSLHIKNLKPKDSGQYTVSKIVMVGGVETGHVHINVSGTGEGTVPVAESDPLDSSVKKGVTSVMLFGAWAGVVLLGVLL